MSADGDWRPIVASALNWGEAHVSLEDAVAGMPAEFRATKASGLPYSVWDILEHIRIAQHDLFDFVTNPEYEHKLDWPADYWPPATTEVSNDAWEKSLGAIMQDREKLKDFTIAERRDLSSKIPGGTGQTYLRTILLAVDHTSYHTGEIVAVRRLIGAWKEKS